MPVSIAATNRDLAAMVDDQKFRVGPILPPECISTARVPPLRERAEDIPRLVRHFAYISPGR